MNKTTTPNIIVEQPEVLKSALDFMPSPVIISQEIDGLYHVLYLNEKFTEIIGYTTTEIPDIKKWFEKAYPDPSYRREVEAEWQRKFKEAIQSGINQLSVVAKVCCKSGKHQWFDIRANIKGDKVYLSFLDIDELIIKREQFQQSEQKFQLLSNNIPALIYLCKADDQWTMVYMNDYCESITSYRKESFLNKKINFYDLYHPDDKDDLLEKYNLAFENLSSFLLEYRILQNDGSYKWIEERGAFIKSPNGELMILGIISDIHDKILSEQQQKETNERLKLATEGAGIGIWDIDYIRGEAYWDPMIYKLMGQSPPKEKESTVKHEDLFKYVHPDDRQKVKDHLEKAVKKAQKYYSEFRIIKPGGEVRNLINAGVFKKDNKGKVTNLLGITYDVTEQKNHESAILKLNKELEEINIQKNKLFSIIAHDLRGPVGRNRALLDIIMHDLNEMSKEEIHTHLEMLQVGTENVNKLLEDLLLWSRTQFDSIKFTPDIIDIKEQIAIVMQTMEAEAQAKGIRLETTIDSASHVIADANMFKTILRNLIANAIKFSYEGSKIEVNTIDGDAEVLFMVKDYGLGMDKDTLREVMSKNSKYTSFGTKGEKGSGLGLSICREFLAKHSKFMKITSKEGRGTTFAFSFNVAHIS